MKRMTVSATKAASGSGKEKICTGRDLVSMLRKVKLTVDEARALAP